MKIKNDYLNTFTRKMCIKLLLLIIYQFMIISYYSKNV